MKRFDRLLAALSEGYGEQANWWPAEGAFEIMVGAILVQRTSWQNAARAIATLRGRGLLDVTSLHDADTGAIESAVRTAGFFRMKSIRLRTLARLVIDHGGIERLAAMSTADLRERLLAIKGIGAETADAMLLYAFRRPVVVVDEYLRRLVGRLHGGNVQLRDDDLRQRVLADLDGTVALAELHALVVTHGQQSCRKTPACAGCCIADDCALGRVAKRRPIGENGGKLSRTSRSPAG
jgi:endonuclease-3 related protein